MVSSMLGKLIVLGGFDYNGTSGLLKGDIAQLAEGEAIAKNETGQSYQHIWNPLTAEVTKNQRPVDVFSVRITMSWGKTWALTFYVAA